MGKSRPRSANRGSRQSRTAGPSGSEPARGSAQQSAPSKKGWWEWLSRANAAVLAAGALAAAVAAVWALKPGPDPVDSASLTVAPLTWPLPLSAYTPTATLASSDGGTAAPGPIAPALVPNRHTEQAQPGVTTAPPAATSNGPATADSSTASESTSAATSTDTTDYTDQSSTTATTTDSSAGTSTDGASTEVSLEPQPIFDLPSDVRDRFYADTVAQPALDGWLLDVDPGPPSPGGFVTLKSTQGVTTDQNGEPLPPEVAAERLAAALGDVRAEPNQGKLDPLGAVATLDVRVNGLRDEPLVLLWQLLPADGGKPPPAEWGGRNPAYQLTAGAEEDSAVVTVWIPLPKEPGPYEIEFLLGLKSGGLPLASGRSEAFG